MFPGSAPFFSSTTAPRVSISSASFGVTCSNCSEPGSFVMFFLRLLLFGRQGRLPDLQRLRHDLDTDDVLLGGRHGRGGPFGRVLLFGAVADVRTDFRIDMDREIARPVNLHAATAMD